MIFDRIKLVIVLALAGATLAAGHVDAHAYGKRIVRTQAQLDRALERFRDGGIIVMKPRRYAWVAVRPGTRNLRIRARGASTRLLLIRDSSSVVVRGLRVGSAASRDAGIDIVRSSGIRLEGGTVYGTALAGARVRLRDEPKRVTFSAMRFRDCGDGFACVLLGGASSVRILGSRFDDCAGCDFVRGRIGSGLIIRDSVFGHAVSGRCYLTTGAWECNHQDHVQIQGGHGILIERNRFGIQEQGAAQIYLTGPLQDVVIRNNFFAATVDSRPDYVTPVGIRVGNTNVRSGPPAGVVIAHNTILSGALHTGQGSDSSIALSPLYADLADRPIIVNNILGAVRVLDWLCGRTAAMHDNIVAEGSVCSENDVLADPQLAADGTPQIESPVVNEAAAGYATDDLHRMPRDELPDIGALEVLP